MDKLWRPALTVPHPLLREDTPPERAGVYDRMRAWEGSSSYRQVWNCTITAWVQLSPEEGLSEVELLNR